MLKSKSRHYLLASACLVVFVVTGYGVDRHETATLFACYFVLFGIYLAVLRNMPQMNEGEINLWVVASILFRASLLYSIPALSDDFYRFIWDGRVLAAGGDPFARVPSYYMEAGHALEGLDQNLFDKLNSKDRFSSYPPVCQFIYWLSVKLSPDSIHGSVLVMKNILLLFEIATLWFIRRLLPRFSIAPSSVLIYALNPLVILEISGNVHFEGVMILFLLMAVYFLLQRRIVASAVAWALSVCTKLIPLIILPLLYHPLGRKQAIRYGAITAVVVLLLYLPLVSAETLNGYATSLGYYFQRFEFNASVYYLVRAIGYLLFGFNIIHFAGPLLALAAAVLIFRMTFRPWHLQYSNTLDTTLFKGMVWCLLIYLLSSTIVHPWYIITLLVISIFSGYRFVVAWTGLIFLTYAGYSETGYNENYFLIAIEYLIVVSIFVFEALWKPHPVRS